MCSYGFGGCYLWEEQEVDSLWNRGTDDSDRVTSDGNGVGERRSQGRSRGDQGPAMQNLGQSRAGELRGSWQHSPLSLPGFRNGNSVRMQTAWVADGFGKKLFQPKFEHCTKNSGRKNFVFFKVLGIRSGWESESEILRRGQGYDGSGREREREK